MVTIEVSGTTATGNISGAEECVNKARFPPLELADDDKIKDVGLNLLPEFLARAAPDTFHGEHFIDAS